MACYREMFPNASVTPKMHILEEHVHVAVWMKCWHTGSGLMGEQGAESIHAESIHAYLRRLEDRSGVANKLQRLLCVVKEHNLKASPTLNSLQPQPKRRKTLIEQ